MNDTIFIGIAAYREYDLLPTLRDCLAKAEHPERIRVCICWQRDESDSLEEFESDQRFDIVDVPYQESKGLCWARNQVQRRYGGETYVMGIDGHHRFTERWDQRLIGWVQSLRAAGCDRPLLTGYAPSFDPANDPAARDHSVLLTGIHRFETSGVLFMQPFRPATAPVSPVPGRFWSGHFNFTLGCFHEQVLVDPDGYFHSEEIVTCVRAWTHGFDIFAPPETVLWHEYSRKDRICHWDDHSEWGLQNHRAIARYRQLFGVDGTPPRESESYGFGLVRSLSDYERFAGVHFATRGVEQHTIDNGIPPGPLYRASEAEWRASLLTSHCLDVFIDRERLEHADCDFWGVFANAEDGTELFRQDYPRSRIDMILATQAGRQISFFIAFFGREQPRRWTVWPYGRRRGWLERIDGYWPDPSGPAINWF